MIELGLGRITRLVRDQTGKLTWKAIHVAGTNGKGSTAAYLSALFHRKGIRVGRFTSPHLIDRWDCITLNQKTVPQQLFLEVEREIQQRDKNGDVNATEFELLTAIAFELFNREKMEVGVIECGIGGLRDATNILEKDEVLCSVITKIGLDHQSFLGNTIEAIAKEKAGIIKPTVPVFTDGTNLDSVKSAIEVEALKKGSNFTEVDHSLLPNSPGVRDLPNHQKDNLSLALAAFQATSLQINDAVSWNPDEVDDIIDSVRQDWRGRLQWLSLDKISPTKSKVLLDGAHNTQSAEVLRDFVSSQLRSDNQNITWVIAMSAGKDVQSILSIMLQPEDQVVTCAFGPVDGMPWIKPQDPNRLEEVSNQYVAKVRCADDVRDAIVAAVEFGRQTDPIVIAGSLYLVSDVLRLLRDSEKGG